MQTFENTEAETLTDDEIAALTADAPAEEGARPGAFRPTDAAGVDWVLRKIVAARGEAALIRANAEQMARACERDAEHLEWRYGADLQAFARQELAGSTRKSLRLFHGVLGYRTKPAGVCLTDPAAALAWAKENLPVAVTEALDRKALVARLLDTGEALPFAALQPAEETFYIK